MSQFLNLLIEQVQVVNSTHVIPPIRNRLQEQLAAERTRVLDAIAVREGSDFCKIDIKSISYHFITMYLVSLPVNATEVVHGVVVVGRLVGAEVASVARWLRAGNPREGPRLGS